MITSSQNLHLWRKIIFVLISTVSLVQSEHRRDMVLCSTGKFNEKGGLNPLDIQVELRESNQFGRDPTPTPTPGFGPQWRRCSSAHLIAKKCTSLQMLGAGTQSAGKEQAIHRSCPVQREPWLSRNPPGYRQDLFVACGGNKGYQHEWVALGLWLLRQEGPGKLLPSQAGVAVNTEDLPALGMQPGKSFIWWPSWTLLPCTAARSISLSILYWESPREEMIRGPHNPRAGHTWKVDLELSERKSSDTLVMQEKFWCSRHSYFSELENHTPLCLSIPSML